MSKFSYKIEKSEDKERVLELKTTMNGWQYSVVEIPLEAVGYLAADLVRKKVVLVNELLRDND